MELEIRAGTQHGNADGMSRMPTIEEEAAANDRAWEDDDRDDLAFAGLEVTEIDRYRHSEWYADDLEQLYALGPEKIGL